MLFFLHNKNRVYHRKGVFTIEALNEIRNKKGFICDMDGVIYHGNKLLPGVKEFVDWLYREDKKFLFLTNSSDRSPRDLMQKLQRMGLDIDETHFYTSAAHGAGYRRNAFLHQRSGNGALFKKPAARLQRLRDGRSGFDERAV